MVHLTETVYAGSIACSVEGSPTPSGAFYVDNLLANTVKQNITRYIYEICRLAHDVVGGIIATLPSEADYRHVDIGPFLQKYLKGAEGVRTEDRVRIARLVEVMTGGTVLVESMHGAGSPAVQRVFIAREARLPEKQAMAKKLAGIEG